VAYEVPLKDAWGKEVVQGVEKVRVVEREDPVISRESTKNVEHIIESSRQIQASQRPPG